MTYIVRNADDARVLLENLGDVVTDLLPGTQLRERAQSVINLAGLTYEEGKGFFEQGLERDVPGVEVPAQNVVDIRRRLREAYFTLYEIIADD